MSKETLTAISFSYMLHLLFLVLCGTVSDAQDDRNADKNPAPPRSTQRFNLFAYSSFSYSHCLETFGAVQMLIDSGRFDATIIVTGPCNNLADRAKNVSQFPERLAVLKSEQIPNESLDKLSLLFSAVERTCVLCENNLFELDKRPEELRNFIDTGDEPLRRNNFSRVETLHRHRKFDVVLCDGFSPACFEFADRHGLAGIYIAVQGPPLPSEMDHNGLWLSACPTINGSLASSCSFRERLAIFISYYCNTSVARFFLNNVLRRLFTDWNGLDPRTGFGMVRAIRKLSGELRRENNAPPMRVEYPSIDQRVLGTTVVPAYYRPDHMILGPTFLKMVNTEFDVKNDARHRQLVDWLDRATKPVVFVSFGTNARLSLHETRVILEGIVSEKWQTVWKITNREFLQEILAANATSEHRLDVKVRALIADDKLQALEWAPQLALLRHPKVKGFVTHGGLSSIMEACANAIPMVCVPLFGDQPAHCAQLAAIGNAIRLYKTDVTPATLGQTIQSILFGESAARFQRKAEQIARYHSRIDTAHRLTEFVQHYAEFKYEFMETSDDYYGWYTYGGLDFMVAVACCLVVALLPTFLFSNLVHRFFTTKLRLQNRNQAGHDVLLSEIVAGFRVSQKKANNVSRLRSGVRRSSSTSSLTMLNNMAG